MPQIEKKGRGFVGNFVRALVLSAAVMTPLYGGAASAQEAVVVKSSQEVAQENLRGALEAMRGGDFLKGAELLDKAAAGSGQLGALAKWADEFKGQRGVLIEERRKAYNEAVGDVQKLIAGKLEEAAIEYARGAYVLAEDKTEFTKQPWVMALMDNVAKRAEDEAGKQQWVKAQRLYADLAAIEPFNKTWKDKLAAIARRTRMLTLYAPDRIKTLLDEDPKMVKEVNAILHPESTTQPSEDKEPTTKPFDRALQIEWKDELKGIKPEMLWYALLHVRSYYWKEPDFTKLMTEGLEGVKALATTNGLEDEFASLKDAEKKATFVARLDELIDQMKAAPKGGEVLKASQVYQALLLANKDTVQVPQEVLVFEFADAALASLDPFTQMLWPAQWEEFNKRTQGEFSGVGVQIQNDDEGNIKVISPIEDSPAFKAGIKAGDLIIASDGKSLKGITTTQAVRVITGPIGTPVVLTIANSDGTGAHDVRLIRDTIHVSSLKGFMYKPGGGGGWDYFIDADQKIAYLRLTDFTKSTSEELDKVANELKKQGARGLIFDLRGNPGGLLTAAFDVANKFLSSGTVVSTRADRVTPQPPNSFQARPDPDEITLPTVVLVNQNSASASEIVSGALKDLGRAMIVGERSYGKGSVQMPFDVTGNKQNAFLKLTISHYYLPSGRCLHRDEDSTTWGVEPDVKVEMTPEQQLVALLARQQFDILRQTGEVPPAEPTTRPGAKGATSRPVIRNAEDLIARDSQLGAALLLMRLKLNGADVGGAPHEAARAGG